MKKLITIVMVIMLIMPAVAFSENPLSDFTVEQLYVFLAAVREQILQRSQWEEVTVPPGHYVIGEDIPTGHWTIKYSPGEVSLIEYFQNADSTGIMPADSIYDLNTWCIGDPEHELSSLYDNKEIDLQLTEGYHLTISYGSAVFVPFTGRQSPFFN